MNLEGLRPVPLSEWPQTGLIRALMRRPEDYSPQDKYHRAILDIFERRLSEEEAAEHMLDIEAFTLAYEDRYLALLEALFQREGKCWVQWESPSSEEKQIWRTLVGLDVPERNLFLQAIRQSSPQPLYYEISSTNVLRMIGQCATRELSFPGFFFPSLSLTLTANFDLSWPIYIEEPNQIPFIEELAQANQLHLRGLTPPSQPWQNEEDARF